ncbi:MAG: transposase [Saccharofermentanales bacterium]
MAISQCAQNLGVNVNTLHNWLSKARKGEEFRGQGNYSSDEAKEIARLKRELKDTKDALEIL